MIRIAIVEDSDVDFDDLTEQLKRYEKERCAETGQSFDVRRFPDAVNFVSDYKCEYDLIFLDIMMPYVNGIDAAKKIRLTDESVAIVFVSNMPQYAVDGYDVHALYYLLKPLSYSTFADKMDNILKVIEQTRNDYLMLEPPFEKRRIFTREIKYIEVFLHDVIFHTFNENIHVHGSLVKFEKLLDPDKFCRISSCYIVNLSQVTAVKDMSVFVGDVELKMSNTRKKALMKAFARFMAASD